MYTYSDKNFEIEVTSKYIGRKAMPDMKQNTNYHIVSVKNKKTGDVDTFEFWNSLIHQGRRKKVYGREVSDVELHEDEQRTALTCLVEDAIAGDMDIDEFVAEFGYEGEKVSKILRIYNACRAEKEKLIALLRCPMDSLYDLVNALTEEENAAY